MAVDQPRRILRRKAELRTEIQKLTTVLQNAAAQLNRLQAESAYLDGMLEFGYMAESSSVETPASVPPLRQFADPDDSVKNPDRKIVAARSLELISSAGRPLSRKTLFKRLKEDGLEVFGKNPLMVLSTMLWRERESIIRIPGFGYWPAGKPYPPGDYFPDQTKQLGLTLDEEAGTSSGKNQ